MALQLIGLNRQEARDRVVPCRLICLFSRQKSCMTHEIRQDPEFQGIKMFGNEVKLSLLDDINLLIAGLASVRRGLKIIKEFGKIAGLYLNVKKTKAIWLGK